MKRNDEQETRRAMELVAALPDVMPEEASERVGRVYSEVQETLRVPIVNLIFRTLANYPDYLEGAWERLRPTLRTRAFERAADALREEALLQDAPDGSDIAWGKTGDMERIRAFNDTIHYILPKLLIVVTLLDEMSLPPGRGPAARATGGDGPMIPLGIAEGTAKVEMVDPEAAEPRVRALFRSIRERHGHPLVSSYHRGLGNWPDFLAAAWIRMEPTICSGPFEERARSVIASAEEWSRSLPVTARSFEAPNEVQRAEIRQVLAAFRVRFIPDMLLNAGMIKTLVDGSAAARLSRFSAAQGVISDPSSPGC